MFSLHVAYVFVVDQRVVVVIGFAQPVVAWIVGCGLGWSSAEGEWGVESEYFTSYDRVCSFFLNFNAYVSFS